ncbi:hypothetical protein ANAPH1_00291 [Anaplasma phagocytophilum]|nr:hypothetical protein ANAPH1_00291 [Anaplasma phagocytophilum]
MVFSSRLSSTRSLATALALSFLSSDSVSPLLVDVGQLLLPSIRALATKFFKASGSVPVLL